MSEELYHYTTMKGALAKKELEHIIYRAFADKIEENKNLLNINPPKEKSFNQLIEEEARNYVRILFEALNIEPYVTSFCQKHQNKYAAENGLLSQWRGYGKDGGVVLVFNKEDLNTMIQHERESYNYVSEYISNVKYSNIPFSEIFLDEIKYIKEYSTDIFWNVLSSTSKEEAMAKSGLDEKLAANTINAILQCLFFYKHQAFSEEQEFRIAMPVISSAPPINKYHREGTRSTKPHKPVYFHENMSGNKTPRIKLFDRSDKDSFFKKAEDSNLLLPIKRIIVGPHKDKESRAKLISLWAQEKMPTNNIEDVIISDIPYIGN
jgi:hypothetical protein